VRANRETLFNQTVCAQEGGLKKEGSRSKNGIVKTGRWRSIWDKGSRGEERRKRKKEQRGGGERPDLKLLSHLKVTRNRLERRTED